MLERRVLAEPEWTACAENHRARVAAFTAAHRGRAHTGERAELLKKMQPQINIHIVDGCKHMVHWDAAADLLRLGVPFLKS